MINFWGAIVFATIVAIGVLDGRSGLSLFAAYRPASPAAPRRRRPAVERDGRGDRPAPPVPPVAGGSTTDL